MMEEKVLDALDLLSDDLIQDVDALRQRGRPASRAAMPLRWGGLAACLCLLIAGGFALRLILTPMGGSGGATGDAAPAAPGGDMGAGAAPAASSGTAPEEFEGASDDFREPGDPAAGRGDQSISSESDGIQSGSHVPEPSGSPTSPESSGSEAPGMNITGGPPVTTMAVASTLTLRIESWQPEGFTAIVVDVGDSPVFAPDDRIEVRFDADSSILLPDGSYFAYGSELRNADQIPIPVGSLVEVAFSAYELDPGSDAAGRVYALRFAPA